MGGRASCDSGAKDCKPNALELEKIIQETDAIKRCLESMGVYNGDKKVWKQLEDHEYIEDQISQVVMTALDQTNVAIYQEKDSKIWQVIIMGTNNPRNVLSDIKFLPKDVEGLRFHTGFANIAEATFDIIKKHVAEGSDCRITGHSLGGGVAAALAWKLHKNGYKVGKVVTFGQPEVLENNCAEKLSKELDIVRFVLHNDPIARLGIPGLVHAGREVELSHDEDSFEIIALSDHYLENYFKSLLSASSLSEELKQSLLTLGQMFF